MLDRCWKGIVEQHPDFELKIRQLDGALKNGDKVSSGCQKRMKSQIEKDLYNVSEDPLTPNFLMLILFQRTVKPNGQKVKFSGSLENELQIMGNGQGVNWNKVDLMPKKALKPNNKSDKTRRAKDWSNSLKIEWQIMSGALGLNGEKVNITCEYVVAKILSEELQI